MEEPGAMMPHTGPPVRRRILIDPERLAGWLGRFADRHGPPRILVADGVITIAAADEAHAWLQPTWEPIGSSPTYAPESVVAYYARARRVGALIVRRSAHAVGVFDGPDLVAGRHDSHYVQGRTKKGGWSQQRYARRRENQADHAFGKAARDVATVLLPEAGHLDALVAGGDSRAVHAVLAGAEFDGLRALLRRPVLFVPDPNQTILRGFAATFRKVPIDLDEKAGNSP